MGYKSCMGRVVIDVSRWLSTTETQQVQGNVNVYRNGHSHCCLSVSMTVQDRTLLTIMFTLSAPNNGGLICEPLWRILCVYAEI